MDKKLSKIIISLGSLFLLNAIFGRYLVLPGYLAGLEAGGGTLEGASQIASTWNIIRYLLWAYSFKLGIYFIILGATILPPITKSSFHHIWPGRRAHDSVNDLCLITLG
jgi:hypothetical protein